MSLTSKNQDIDILILVDNIGAVTMYVEKDNWLPFKQQRVCSLYLDYTIFSENLIFFFSLS